MLLTALLLLLSCRGVRAGRSEPAAAFRGSDRYDFALEVPAAGMECLWHFAHRGGIFYLIFMVQSVTGVANSERLFVTVSSPQGALMASRNDAVGHLTFQTEVTGFYRLCLGNHDNHFGRVRVFVDFGVLYEGFEESMGEEEEEEERVLNSTLAGIEESVQKLQDRIFQMWRHYSFARMSKGKDHLLLLSNLSYVTWWSAAQSLLILLSGYLQLFVLKRLFHVEPGRPRC